MVILLCLLCLCLRIGAAVAEPLTFQVSPGGAVVEDAESGATLAHTGDGPRGSVSLSLDTAVPHQLRIERPPFDPLTMRVWWDGRGGWHYPDGLLNDAAVLSLSRTIRLNVSPSDVQAYVDIPGDSARDIVIDVSGARRTVTPLSQREGHVVIPRAWSPEPLYLVRSGFDPYVLQIPAGALATPGESWPEQTVHLRPTFGPFSYPLFNGSLLVFGLMAAGLWWGWLRPRRLARRRQQDLDLAVAREVMQVSRSAAPRTGNHAALGEVIQGDQGGYLLARVLGQGGMGTVYEALPVTRPEAERVAVKVLQETADNASLARFHREIGVCRQLHHASLIKVLDSGTCRTQHGAEVPFMVMELVEGKTLQDVRAESPEGLPPAIVAGWMMDVLKGLRTAHAVGIIHRDLKPANLMLTASGRVKVMDFGIAHVRDSDLTTSREIVGTPKYMSPEHLQAATVTPASDLYSLGVIAYELLAGRHPYCEAAADAWQVIGQMLMKRVQPLHELSPAVPERLSAVVGRLLEPDLSRRYPDAWSAIQDLEPLVTPS